MALAAILFALTALGGAVMAAIRLAGKPQPPLIIAGGHGLLAAMSLAVLGYAVFAQGAPFLAQVAFGMFVATAGGGLVLLLGFHLRSRPLPIPFVLGHGALALASLGVLLVAIFS